MEFVVLELVAGGVFLAALILRDFSPKLRSSVWLRRIMVGAGLVAIAIPVGLLALMFLYYANQHGP